MNFKHHFLVAMPCMPDNRFKNTVIYICEHNDEGAIGFIINKQLDITVTNMIEHIDIEHLKNVTHPLSLAGPLYLGGPVSEDRGFVLHKNIPDFSATTPVSDGFSITTSKEILSFIGTENEPEQFIILLGYSGWGTGQLENELATNSWLTMEADPSIIFNTPCDHRWETALKLFGVNPLNLSSDIGHA